MGPGLSFFDALFRAVGRINIIAEDLVRIMILSKQIPKMFQHYNIISLARAIAFHSFMTLAEAGPCNCLGLYLWQGVITEDVVQLRKSIGAPGMAVLQFGNHY